MCVYRPVDAGLKIGDFIISIWNNTTTAANYRGVIDTMKPLSSGATELQMWVGRTGIIDPINVKVIPKVWGGTGTLGCSFVDYVEAGAEETKSYVSENNRIAPPGAMNKVLNPTVVPVSPRSSFAAAAPSPMETMEIETIPQENRVTPHPSSLHNFNFVSFTQPISLACSSLPHLASLPLYKS